MRQPRGKPWCGPACVQMVLAAHGITKKQCDIAAALPMTRQGIHVGNIGTYFLSLGFYVIACFWIRGMQPRFAGANGEAARRALWSRLNNSACTRDRRMWPTFSNRMSEFCGAGGQISLTPTPLERIKQALAQGEPPIINIYPFLLYRDGRVAGGHYIVPLEYREPGSVTLRYFSESSAEMWYADPCDGEEHCANPHTMMLACHLWHGAGLFISKKS